ncbi:MAG: hypothetical protein ABSH02_20275, partial [Candidatus Sulfotelmatobacter sp.]
SGARMQPTAQAVGRNKPLQESAPKGRKTDPVTGATGHRPRLSDLASISNTASAPFLRVLCEGTGMGAGHPCTITTEAAPPVAVFDGWARCC